MAITTSGQQAVLDGFAKQYKDALYVAVYDSHGCEIDRVACVYASAASNRAQLQFIFPYYTGTGVWYASKVFDAAADVLLDEPCDSISNWTSDNTLSLDTAQYQHSAGSIRSDGAETLSFENTSLSVSSGADTDETWLRFWYHVDDASKVSDVTVTLGCEGYTDAFTYTFTPSDGWNWVSVLIDNMASVGSPSIAAIDRIKLESTKSASVTERLDAIALWHDNDSDTVYEMTDYSLAPVTKQAAEARSLYWTVSLMPSTLNLFFYIGQNDTKPCLEAQLTHALVPQDLTGASVQFVMGSKVNAPATIVDAEHGRVEYCWQAGDTDTAGSYDASFVVTYADSSTETFPQQVDFTVVITA